MYLALHGVFAGVGEEVDEHLLYASAVRLDEVVVCHVRREVHLDVGVAAHISHEYRIAAHLVHGEASFLHAIVAVLSVGYVQHVVDEHREHVETVEYIVEVLVLLRLRHVAVGHTEQLRKPNMALSGVRIS